MATKGGGGSSSGWNVVTLIVVPIAVALIGLLGLLWTQRDRTSADNPPGQSPPSATTVSRSTSIQSPASDSGTGASGNGGSPAIYHQGTLTLAFNTCADLDAPPTDRQWGEPSANPDAGGADFCSQSPSFVGANSATLVTSTSGTDSACQNATGWLAPNLYQDLHLGVGSFVCVHTNQDRYSLLRVEATNPTTNAITFWVKTFK
jgi:hypothetical protein